MTAEHGYGPYSNGCRCDTCRAAKADYMRTKRARAAALRIAVEIATGGRIRYYAGDHFQHGLAGYQDLGCRCPTCTAAKSASDRKAGP